MIDKNEKPVGRDAVEKFFTFYFDGQDHEIDSPAWGWIAGGAVISFIFLSRCLST